MKNWMLIKLFTLKLEFGLCLQITAALLERLRGLTPCLNMPVWRSEKKRPDGQKDDVKFYFYIKYINKASAGGIRSMCTFSDTHMYVCRTQTHRQAYTPHNINQNDGSCSHLGTQTWLCLHQCQHPTQVTWSLEAPQQFSLMAPAAMILKKCFNNSKISRTRSHDTMLELSHFRVLSQ